jgi:hypothetical protein
MHRRPSAGLALAIDSVRGGACLGGWSEVGHACPRRDGSWLNRALAGAHGQVSVHHGARQSRSGSSGLVSYHCEFRLEEASALGMVPATAGFRGRAGGLTMGVDDRDSFPAPVLGPFMLCSVECIPGTPPAPPCMGTVTLKALLSK